MVFTFLLHRYINFCRPLDKQFAVIIYVWFTSSVNVFICCEGFTRNVCCDAKIFLADNFCYFHHQQNNSPLVHEKLLFQRLVFLFIVLLGFLLVYFLSLTLLWRLSLKQTATRYYICSYLPDDMAIPLDKFSSSMLSRSEFNCDGIDAKNGLLCFRNADVVSVFKFHLRSRQHEKLFF